MNNLLPATTFVIALIFRMERVKVREIRSQAKIVGTLICVSGAMLMTLYKGALLRMPWSSHHHHHSSNASTSHDSNSDMIKGCLCLIIATLAWAVLFVLQASVLKKYSAQLSLATLICLMGSLQSIAITLAVERRPSAWAIGFDMNLLTAVYWSSGFRNRILCARFMHENKGACICYCIHSIDYDNFSNHGFHYSSSKHLLGQCEWRSGDSNRTVWCFVGQSEGHKVHHIHHLRNAPHVSLQQEQP
ncbi:hypothetical protein SUGI_0856020 [Cryptomeria japonica]|nr:hypothetical protein SUGI_0856020 [Cryptomeria japonica]